MSAKKKKQTRLEAADAMLLESENAWLIAYGWRPGAGVSNFWHAPPGFSRQKIYIHDHAVSAQKLARELGKGAGRS